MFGVPLISMIGSVVFGASAILWVILVVALAVTVGIGSSKMYSLSSKKSILGYIAVAVAVVIDTGVALLHPVSDLYYYGGAILSLIAVLLSITDIIRYYNVLSTRRLPQFDKQGGDDHA